MLIRHSLCRHWLAGAFLLLSGTGVSAQQPQANGPYLNYNVTPNPQTGTENITFTLYGFTNDPSVSPQGVILDPATYRAHTIYAFQEKLFEQLGGTVTPVQTPQGWTFFSDSAYSGGPIYPTDPVTGFLATATVPTGPSGRQVHLYDQVYSFYNQPLDANGVPQPGSLIATGKPCPDGQVCYGSVVSNSAPEPMGPATFAVAALGVLGRVLCQRRRLGRASHGL